MVRGFYVVVNEEEASRVDFLLFHLVLHFTRLRIFGRSIFNDPGSLYPNSPRRYRPFDPDDQVLPGTKVFGSFEPL